MENRFVQKIKWSTVLHLVLALFLVLFTISLLISYLAPRISAPVQKVVQYSPYPLALINYTHGISFRELSQNIASVRRFYENQDFSKIGLRIDFSTDEGQKRLKVREKEVLNKMIEDQAIALLARERGITVTDEMAKQGVTRKLEEYGSGDEVKKNLDRLYGWTLQDFEQKVVLPSLYQDKLVQSFEKEVDTTGPAKEKVEKAKQLLSSGKSFEDVAKQLSEGQTAATGGELGWFTLDDLAPELRKSVALQKIGIPGEVIESSLGYHIVLVEEVKKEKDQQLYRLRQIFARKEIFSDWLTEKMKSLSIWVLSPEYYWDKNTARVEFRSQDMRNFEQELYKKTNGDAMFFF